MEDENIDGKELKDTIQKHANVELGTQEEIILKDKFLTQSALDICRKFQKLNAETGKSLDEVGPAGYHCTVFYNRDLENERIKDKHQEALIMALQRFLQKQTLTYGSAYCVDRKAILGRSAPGGKGHL
jgi:hypothetical protein